MSNAGSFELIFKMAWLNVWRRSRRSMLVIMMIAVSMSTMLSIQGLYDGMAYHMIKSVIESDCGEISIYDKAYRLDPSLKHHITETSKVLEEVNAMPEVKTVAERIIITGLGATARKSTMARLIGTDLEQERRFGEFERAIIEGEAAWGKKERYCIIGKKLAETLRLSPGQRIIFSSQNLEGDITSISLRIGAVIQTTNMAIDDTGIYISLARSEAFAGLGHDERTQIALRLESGADIATVQQQLQQRFPDLEVSSWIELYPTLDMMQTMMFYFNGISFAIVMLVVFIGIMGVMMVSILERIREFGILMAIGSSYKQLRTQVIIEALMLGLLGYAIGTLLGLAALYYLQNYGIDLSDFAAGMEAFGIASTVYGVIKFSYFTTTLAAIILASFLSVILPLRSLKKLKPIEVIQGEY
jgi:ABC-type lipoprotein release transport system permease subunit